jgi:RNA polymerase sigma-70 factor, ECF subfamily
MTATPPNLQSEAVEDNSERDTALLRRVALKDTAAFAELHRYYTPLLIYTVNRVLDDYEDTRDIVQDVFVTLWQKAHLYEPSKGKPTTWLTTLARNRAIDLVRARQRRSHLRDRFEAERNVVSDDVDTNSADKALLLSERAAQVRKAMNRLSPSQKDAIEKAFLGGQARKTMASASGEPVGTIKARVRRGLKAMNAMLARDLKEQE